MRIINKKYLLIIILVGIILTSVIVAKPKQEVKLDDVILKQEINNKTFAMYTETDDGYEEYDGNSFPKGYQLNINQSKCIDKDGVEIENVLYTEDNKVGVRSNKSVYCYLYFDKVSGFVEDLSGNGNNGISFAALWNNEGLTTSNDDKLGYVDCGLSGYNFHNTISIVIRLKWNKFRNDYQASFGNIGFSGERNGLVLAMGSDLIPYLEIFNENISQLHSKFSSNVETDKWYDLILIYDNKNAILYVNGNKNISEQITSEALGVTDLPIYLGTYSKHMSYDDRKIVPAFPHDYSFTTFSNLLIFDSVLSEEEIQEYFSGEINKDKVIDKYVNNESNQDLLLYYKFD